MKKILLLLTVIFFSQSQIAQATSEWNIIPDQSKIEFLANQEGTEISGSFKKFSGEIFFDKADLKNSQVTINIDLTSLSSSFSGALDTLSSKDWFYFAKFPQAKFTSNKFTKIAENKFRCDGFLQIKDKKLPINFDFFFEEYSAKKAKAIASLVLSRSAFGVGSKNEKSANGVKDEVVVKLLINATRHN